MPHSQTAGPDSQTARPEISSPRRVTAVDALSRLPRARDRGRGRGRRAWPLLAGVAATVIVLAVSIFVGVADITGDDADFLWITRIPRTASLMLAGGSMAMAGLVMQLLTQNRYVEPTTVGTTEWAGLGLLLTSILIPSASVFTKMAVAIACAFAGTLVFFAFLRRVTLKSSLIVPIVGIMFGAVIGAVTTFLAIQANLLQVLGGWFLGRFSGAEAGRYELLWIVLAVAVVVAITATRFTIAGLGKDVATNMGLSYERVMLLGVGLVAITTGVVTVTVGMLPFLGLVVPNLVSMIRGDDLRTALPWVFLTGIWLVTVCDLIGRVVIMPFEVPVSLVLGVVGSAVFLVMVLRTRRVHAA